GGGNGQLAMRDPMARDRARQRAGDGLAEFVERFIHGGIPSVHDEEPRALRRMRAMRISSVGHLVAHAGLERERAPIREIGVQLAVHAEDDVALLAPMVGNVARRVVDHPDANLTELARAPGRDPALTRMGRRIDTRPIGGAEGNVADAHWTFPLTLD